MLVFCGYFAGSVVKIAGDLVIAEGIADTRVVRFGATLGFGFWLVCPD